MGTVHAKDIKESGHSHDRMKQLNLQGVKARVDQIYIDGLARTKDDIVKDCVKDLFNANNFEDVIIKSHRVRSQLDTLGCFQNIKVKIDISSGPKATPDGLQVTFQVLELSRVVGGVTTNVCNNEGSLVLGLKMPNTCGRGENLQCEYSMGNRKTTNFSILWLKPFPSRKYTPSFSMSLFQHASEYPWTGYSLLDKGLLLDLGFKTSSYTKHNLQWEGVMRHTSGLVNRTKETPFVVREEFGPVLKSILRHIITVDRRDDTLFPTNGSLVQVTNELCGLGGGVAYLKNNLLLQTNHEVYKDHVVQASFTSGMLYNIHDTKLSDHFFLGGPLSIRGFQERGAGPQKDGSSLGGTVYWASGLHLFAPLPFRPGKGGLGDLFRSHFFINAGNVINADQDDLGSCLPELLRNIRVSLGAGLALRIGRFARFELNYCFPVKSQTHDCTVSGVQFGIGVNFL